MTDRNVKARDEFAIAQARKQFMQALSSGQTGVYDDLGLPLKAGQFALYSVPPNQWRWLVADVAPDLRPTVPVGTMRVVMRIEVPLYIQAGTRMPSILVIGDSEQLATAPDVPAVPPDPTSPTITENGSPDGTATDPADPDPAS